MSWYMMCYKCKSWCEPVLMPKSSTKFPRCSRPECSLQIMQWAYAMDDSVLHPSKMLNVQDADPALKITPIVR